MLSTQKQKFRRNVPNVVSPSITQQQQQQQQQHTPSSSLRAFITSDPVVMDNTTFDAFQDDIDSRLSSSYDFGDSSVFFGGGEEEDDVFSYSQQQQQQYHQQSLRQSQQLPQKIKRRRSRKTIIPGKDGSFLSFSNGILGKEAVELLNNNGNKGRPTSGGTQKTTGLRYLHRLKLENKLSKAFSVRRGLTPPQNIKSFFYAQSTTIINKLTQLCKKTGLPFFICVGYPNVPVNNHLNSAEACTEDDDGEDEQSQQQQQQLNDSVDTISSSSSSSTSISAFVASSVPAEHLSEHFNNFVTPAVSRIISSGLYTSKELAKKVISMKEKMYAIEQQQRFQQQQQQQQQPSSTGPSKSLVGQKMVAKLEMEYMCPGMEIYWESMKKKKNGGDDAFIGDLAPCIIDQNTSQETTIAMIEQGMITEDEARELDERSEYTDQDNVITSSTISPEEHQSIRNELECNPFESQGKTSLSCMISARPSSSSSGANNREGSLAAGIMACDVSFISPLERISGK